MLISQIDITQWFVAINLAGRVCKSLICICFLTCGKGHATVATCQVSGCKNAWIRILTAAFDMHLNMTKDCSSKVKGTCPEWIRTHRKWSQNDRSFQHGNTMWLSLKKIWTTWTMKSSVWSQSLVHFHSQNDCESESLRVMFHSQLCLKVLKKVMARLHCWWHHHFVAHVCFLVNRLQHPNLPAIGHAQSILMRDSQGRDSFTKDTLLSALD